jgi:uncharacterized damage-inducible protein DinB
MNPQAYAGNFTMHRAALIELLEKVPAEKGDFAAWEGGMSFVKIADHLSGSSKRMAAMSSGQQAEKLEPSADLGAAVQRLKDTHSEVTAALGMMPAEMLGQKITAFGGREMPIAALLDFMVQHEAHHKGQAWMMARMIGLEPGMFVKM